MIQNEKTHSASAKTTNEGWPLQQLFDAISRSKLLSTRLRGKLAAVVSKGRIETRTEFFDICELPSKVEKDLKSKDTDRVGPQLDAAIQLFCELLTPKSSLDHNEAWAATFRLNRALEQTNKYFWNHTDDFRFSLETHQVVLTLINAILSSTEINQETKKWARHSLCHIANHPDLGYDAQRDSYLLAIQSRLSRNSPFFRQLSNQIYQRIHHARSHTLD